MNTEITIYPLRRVLGLVFTKYGFQEQLECGHIMMPKQDIYGRTNPNRRRCHKCASGKPPDNEEQQL